MPLMFPAFCLLPSAFCLLAAVAASPAPPDIRDIVAPQPYYILGSYWLLLVAAACLVAALAVAWILFKSLRKPKPVVVPTPREVAEGRLAALQARMDETDARAFGGEVADILRAFIGTQYNLRAERQTSPEFLESIRGWPYFSAIQHTLLQDFLTQCDLLKFARQDATHDAKLRLLGQAAQFLASEPPTLPAGAPAVASGSARAIAMPPPLPPMPFPPVLPGTMDFESPDARYMPPAQRQTPLPPDAPVPAATEP